jgi:transposase
MSYNVSAFYLAQTAMKNRLEALPKPTVGILSGTNAPVIDTGSNLVIQALQQITLKSFIRSQSDSLASLHNSAIPESPNLSQIPARKALPAATQCADRFHIYKNLTEAVELALARCRSEMRKQSEKTARQEVSPEAHQALKVSKKSFSLTTWKPSPAPCDERARLTRRAQRYDRYQQVVALDAQGFEQTEIAGRVGLSKRTIQRWLAEDSFPEARPRRKRRSIFDPYAAYVLKRWGAGQRNGLRLYQEIKEQGFSGTPQTVYRFLRRLREQLPLVQAVSAPPTPVQDVVAKETVWLFVRDPEQLDESEQRTLAAICQTSSTAKTLYQLVQEFREMLHTRSGGKLDEWLEKVRSSQIAELQGFVTGIERDKAAVVAGLTLPQNNDYVA